PESAMLYAEHTRVKQYARFGLRLVFGLRLLSAFALGALAADMTYETLLSWVGQPSYVTLMMLGLCGFLIIYSLEPVWRYHAVSAVGLAVASSGRNTVNGWVVGFGAVFAIWLIQAAITIGFTAVLITLLNSIPIPVSLGLGDPYNNIAYNIIIFGILFIGCMLTGVIICGFYALLARFSLRYAAQRAFGE
ncbi:MAG: hypothetical protein H7Y11_01540, partial [Armatimonadetes bacterium]|nr:hypothetical protein [Anaerolineae bacterium]